VVKYGTARLATDDNTIRRRKDAVAQLVEALPTSRKVAGSLPDGVIGIFYCHIPSGRTTAPGVDSVSNRNEYQEYYLGGKGGQCVGLTTLPASCAGCLEIWESQPPGTLRACPGM
jgi:hypothetical protein